MTTPSGISVPDAGTTTTYIIDQVGGMEYQIDTTIAVTPIALGYIQKQLDDELAVAQQQADAVQARIDAYQTAVAQAEPVAAETGMPVNEVASPVS